MHRQTAHVKWRERETCDRCHSPTAELSIFRNSRHLKQHVYSCARGLCVARVCVFDRKTILHIKWKTSAALINVGQEELLTDFRSIHAAGEHIDISSRQSSNLFGSSSNSCSRSCSSSLMQHATVCESGIGIAKGICSVRKKPNACQSV